MMANLEPDFVSLNLSQVLFAVPLGYGLNEVGGGNGKEKSVIKRRLGQRRKEKVRTHFRGTFGKTTFEGPELAYLLFSPLNSRY